MAPVRAASRVEADAVCAGSRDHPGEATEQRNCLFRYHGAPDTRGSLLACLRILNIWLTVEDLTRAASARFAIDGTVRDV